MTQHPILISLSKTDRASLQTFIHAGKANARSFTRAHALLKAADGWTDAQICEAFGITATPLSRYANGISRADWKRSCSTKSSNAIAAALTGEQAAHLIAVSCTPVHDGHDHWTLRLLAGKAVELGFVESISPETIRSLLKKTKNGNYVWSKHAVIEAREQ